nr:hypothetical protein BgiMline_006275 [Biomphalaria glabrata]
MSSHYLKLQRVPVSAPYPGSITSSSNSSWALSTPFNSPISFSPCHPFRESGALNSLVLSVFVTLIVWSLMTQTKSFHNVTSGAVFYDHLLTLKWM